MRLSLFALLVLLIAGTGEPQDPVQDLGPQGPPYRPDRPIAIVGGLLIDATGAPPRLDHAVIIEGERIARVGPMDEIAIPEGAQIIDAAGMTIMPGLINSNQHIQLNPMYPNHRFFAYPAETVSLTLAALKARWELTFARMPQRSFVYLMQGVTSQRHTSGPLARLLPVKEAIDTGEIPGPRLFLGGALFRSEVGFDKFIEEEAIPEEAVDWMRNDFAFNVIADADRDTDAFVGPDFHYWKLVMGDERFDGKNDFTDEQIRFIIDKAHKLGKRVDVHTGGHNDGLRRMLAFDIDTVQHPFYGNELIDLDIIESFKKKGVVAATLLTVMVAPGERAADPHRFSETTYAMSMEPTEYRLLMEYRDKMLANLRKPDEPGLAIYGGGRGQSFNEIQEGMRISRENMRRFIKGGVKFWMGTDTPTFLNYQQEDPNANEMRYMVEMGMTPMQAIEASTRNGAEALGVLDRLGTIEAGKLADVIVVAGNPLDDMRAMKRVYAVIKGGVRYK